MDSLMRSIARTFRCYQMYRGDLMEQEEITGPQYSYILRVCETPGISQDQLAEAIYVNKSNVTRQLAQLEQGGLIKRVASSQDRRQLLVYPTERAKALYPRLKEIQRDWNEQLLADFSEEERQALYRMMERVMQKALQLLQDERSAKKEEEPPCKRS